MPTFWLWTLLVGTFGTLIVPVTAQCDPSHAVVAVASILSTLAVVAIVLVAVYFFLRKRRQAHSLQHGWDKVGVRGQGQVNNGFADNDEFILVTEGPSPSKRKGQAKSYIIPTADKDHKTWSSLPRPDKASRLYREGSCGSLDENNADPETVSVLLESQDIIGLGFNICGGYGDGIRVSEVHNRGPAKESGDIKVGDRILSVTVSYENIVYEDALTILSYASPYPVKIVLEKATDGTLRNFSERKAKLGNSRRLAHPLYRSQSMDTLKSNAGNKTRHPKRALSELKIESGKRFLKWRGGKTSKKGSESSDKDGMPPAKVFKSGKDRPASVDSSDGVFAVEKDIIPQAVSQKLESVYFSKQEDNAAIHEPKYKQPDFEKVGSKLQQVTVEVLSPDDRNGPDDFNQRTPPDKPERKNRRKSDLQNSPSAVHSGFDEIIVPSTTAFTFSTPPGAAADEEDEDEEVSEETIVPEIAKKGEGDNVSEAEPVEQKEKPWDDDKDISEAIELLTETDFVDFIEPRRSPSPDADPVEEEPIVASVRDEGSVLSATPPSHIRPEKLDLSNNNESTSEDKKPSSPLLDDDTLERIIAMNAFAPGTQGWAGVSAGGQQGGIVDDFVPNNPFFTAQPVPKPTSPDSTKWNRSADASHNINSGSPLNNNRSLAYEIRDDVVSGKPFAVGLNKHKYVVRTGSEQFDPQTINAEVQNIKMGGMRTVGSFDRATGLVDHNIVTVNNVNDEKEGNESLEWSGQRLVRSDSFSNIFVND